MTFKANSENVNNTGQMHHVDVFLLLLAISICRRSYKINFDVQPSDMLGYNDPLNNTYLHNLSNNKSLASSLGPRLNLL